MILIRHFTPEDADEVRDLIQGIMNEEFHDDRAAYPNDDLKNIPETYGSLGEAFFVAVKSGKIVGTVAIKREDDRVALLRRLFVAAPHRHQQIGGKLIDRALEFCEEVGYKEVIFKSTSRMEAAGKTCEKKGFVQRAKIDLGNIELFKFALSLRHGRLLKESKIRAR